MKKCFLLTSLAVLWMLPLFAQEPQTSQKEYLDRYNMLVSHVGATGVGIETMLGKWEKDYPEDVDMLAAKFVYYLGKSRSSSVEQKPVSKYLGEAPIFTLKDSLDNPVNYFEVANFDDELFGKAMSSIDKAIQLLPDRLDLRMYKISALVAYEKDSPDMATSELKTLIDYNRLQHPAWVYPGAEKVDKDFFDTAIQEFCFTFFRYGTPATYAAFRDLSEKMLEGDAKNVLFLDNVGSYYLVAAKDSKTALKYYNKVLKIKPSDITAIRNCILLARNEKNVKLEKKYLPMMVKYGETDTDKQAAQARLAVLSGKK